MRLIDRDKFINDMFDLYLDAKWSPQDVHFSLLDVRFNIDSPKYEVEAIPIEWIKKKSLEFLMNKNFRYATDFQEVIDMWKVENNIPLFDGELKITMEKENE